jgi:hypothetical protein
MIKRSMVEMAEIRACALALPEVEEGPPVPADAYE